MKSQNGIIYNIKYISRLVNEFDRKIIKYSVFRNSLEKGFYSFFFVYFIKIIYELIEGQRNYIHISIFLGTVCLIQALVYIISNQYDYYLQVNTPQIMQGVYMRVFRKAMHIPLERVENPEYYGKYTRSLDNAQNSIMQIISLLGETSGQITRLILLVIITISIDPILLFLPAICIINSIVVASARGKVEYKQRKELSEYERKCAYCKRVFYEKKYSQELRLYKIGSRIETLYNDSIEKLQMIRKKYFRSLTALEIWDKAVLRICLLVVTCIYLAYKVIVLHKLTVSSFAGAMAAVSNISYCMGFLAHYLGELFKHGADCQNLIDFLESDYIGDDLNEESLVPQSLQSLEIKDLSYSYPESEKNVLNNIFFSIKKGEKIAVVGFNGAGKTTLVKILLGLYKGYEGNVYWNGMPINQFVRADYNRCVNSVLQDFSVYELSIAQNVTMGQISEDRDRISEALRLSGLWDKVNKLDKGIDSSITKELDSGGVSFSGGELQKIATSRVFYNKHADFVIMDEPTSAMDPISEYNVYKNLFKSLNDKTMLFVSHRLLTCTMADKILVMDKGRIIEQGNHNELMEKNGKYAKMYRIQSSKVTSIGKV